MNTHQQYTLDALMRGQGFLDAHDDIVGPLKQSSGRKQLDEAVIELLAKANDQLTAGRVLRGISARQQALVTELKEQHMLPIAKFARAKLRGVPDFAALSRSSSNLRGSKLVTSARAMASAAATVSDVLAAAEFGTDAVQQLSAAADAVAQAITDRGATRVARGVATASLRQHLSLGKEALAMLDPIVTKRLAGNEGLLAGWRQAKHIGKRPGEVNTSAVAAPPAEPANTTAA